MAVISDDTKDNEITLKIDNGDYIEFKKVMQKWKFKDHQSLMRFAISLLVLNENKYFPMKVDNQERDIVPAPHLIKEEYNEK